MHTMAFSFPFRSSVRVEAFSPGKVALEQTSMRFSDVCFAAQEPDAKGKAHVALHKN